MSSQGEAIHQQSTFERAAAELTGGEGNERLLPSRELLNSKALIDLGVEGDLGKSEHISN